MSQGMTPKEAAEQLRCSADQVVSLIKAGQLTASNIGLGKQRARWLILPESLDEFLRRRQTKQAVATKRTAKPKPSRKEWV